MDVIVISQGRGRTWRFRLNRPVVAVFGLALGVLMSGLVLLGYGLREPDSVLGARLLSQWADEIHAQHRQLLALRAQAQTEGQALSRRLAELQARVMRLDAAGSRLTQIAELDASEFDFGAPVPVGGPESEGGGMALSVEASQALLQDFERQLASRERQLRVLEDLLLASRLQREVHPSGWPIAGGWISSAFGMRNDPFTGRRAFHSGMDFAGHHGADVMAVAAGVVEDVGHKPGYGLLVEVNHGNGYVTRYGHNSRALVRVGDSVKKGQRVALMGQSGRATGPHVHFEVLLNGKVVNPEQYIYAAR